MTFQHPSSEAPATIDPSLRAQSAPAGPPRRQMVAAWITGTALAWLIVLGNSGMTPDRFAYGDGLIYRYVASNLTTPPDQVHEVVRERGTSLRYGRIGMPALIWAASAGREQAMPYAQAMIVALAAGAACAAALALFPKAGPLGMLLPFLAPGFVMALSGGFADALALSLALWGVVLAARGRWWLCAALLSMAMLTRENAGWIALALFLWLIWTRRFKPAAILPISLVPLAAWYATVAIRFGHVPVLDPYLRESTETVGLPVWAAIQSLVDGASASSVVVAALHLGLGVVAVALARNSLLGFVAAIASAQLLITGPFAWQFIGEGARTAIFIHVFTIMAIADMLNRHWGHASLLGPRARAATEAYS